VEAPQCDHRSAVFLYTCAVMENEAERWEERNMVAHREIGKTRISLEQGDITGFTGDAVVNAANDHLWMGAGVAGAIKRRGGSSIEGEAVGRGPINVGEAVVTDGGNLEARYVIHAAVMGQDLVTDEKIIRSATQNSLYKCDELSISSVAFPAFGTGVGGFPADACARAMLEEVAWYLQEETDTSLREVVFYLFAEETMSAFKRALDNVKTGD